ncbi:kelch-like protein 40 [Contarinia nasturtii]|uniref:kelch-like protein 40 n=1 Tax=Contarinia nasturtii TaxID=265458 RepID=UPI0012D44CFB|nr:kelch-like protein 40 [Contarinia nasturtii]
MLAALSPVFKAMFFGPNKEKGDVKIADANGQTFKEFLQFFYLNNVKISMECIEDVIRLADKYLIIDCVKECASKLVNNLSLDDICFGYQLAIILGAPELRKYCEKMISAFPLDIFKSNTFLQCNQIILQHILEIDTLQCKESDVFDACLLWAKQYCKQNGIDENKPENLKAALKESFELIRFGAMKVDDFTVHARMYSGMFTNDELADLLFTTTISDYISNKFAKEPRKAPAFQWNNEQMLICNFDNTMSSLNCWVKDYRYPHFSTNCAVLLGEIYFHRLQKHDCGSSKPSQLTLNVKIIEFSDHSFESCVLKRVLFNGQVSYASANESKIKLSRPILINPRKMYQITWEGSSDNYYYYETDYSDVNVNNYLTVKLHSEYNHNRHYQRVGLISRLCFNRL